MEPVGFHIQLLNLYPGREERREGGKEKERRGEGGGESKRREGREGRKGGGKMERGRGFMKSFGSREWAKIKSS